jgi:hemoglobin
MKAIYDDLGGAEGLRTAVSIMYARVTTDPELAQWFADIDMDRLRVHQRAFLVAAFGGPQLFGGRSLAQAHAHLAITDVAFDRIVATLMTALADLGVPNEAIAGVGRRLEETRADIVRA